VLVVVLSIVSPSPVADLLWVALAFVLATAVAALLGLVIGVVSKGRGRLSDGWAIKTSITMSPYVTAFALIARAEYGALVAATLIAAYMMRQPVRRLVRRARAALRRALPAGSW
jgi:hypothetical protein